jgi:hypothetical protein
MQTFFVKATSESTQQRNRWKSTFVPAADNMAQTDTTSCFLKTTSKAPMVIQVRRTQASPHGSQDEAALFFSARRRDRFFPSYDSFFWKTGKEEILYAIIRT